MALTDTQCCNAKPKDKTYRLFDGGGLYLENTPAGGQYWKVKYRYLGKEKKLSLGAYPIISLQEARLKLHQVKRMLHDGIDPAQVKQDEKRQKLFDAKNTFHVVGERWHDHNTIKWSKNHSVTVRRRLEQDVYPVLGAKPIAEIKAPDIIHMIRKIEERGAYTVARRALQYTSQIFDYAYCHAIVEDNPTVRMKKIVKSVPVTNYACIDIRDLPQFLQTFRKNDARLYPQTMIAIELVMLTFVRTSELIKATWDEFDFDEKLWVIPAQRMKMKRDHIVPLSDRATELFLELKRMNGHREYILPSKTNPRKHMSNNTILMALRRMGYGGEMTGHGFRALAMSTIVEKLKYPEHIPDRQLAHARKSSVMAAYNRAEFLDDRIKMMQDWSDYLKNLEDDNA